MDRKTKNSETQEIGVIKQGNMKSDCPTWRKLENEGGISFKFPLWNIGFSFVKPSLYNYNKLIIYIYYI